MSRWILDLRQAGPQRTGRLGWTLAALGGVALLLAAVLCVQLMIRAQALDRTWRAQSDERRAGAHAQTVQTRAALEQLRPRIAQASPLLLTPWPELLAALEAAAMPEVQVHAFEPDALGGQLRLELQAVRLEHAVEYLDRLQANGTIYGLRLLSHDTLNPISSESVSPGNAALPSPAIRVVATGSWVPRTVPITSGGRP